MVRKAYKKKLNTAELRQLGQSPNFVTRRVRRPTTKNFTHRSLPLVMTVQLVNREGHSVSYDKELALSLRRGGWWRLLCNVAYEGLRKNRRAF
jgi:hypothetical protein